MPQRPRGNVAHVVAKATPAARAGRHGHGSPDQRRERVRNAGPRGAKRYEDRDVMRRSP
jgi:hypothetical protein